MSEDAGRERLAAQQAALLRALLGGGPVPDGFNAARVAAQSVALLDKRRRVTALVRPDLADALGERFQVLFTDYARAHPKQTGRTARADAEDFTTWLIEHGHLPRPTLLRRLVRGRNRQSGS